MPLNPVERRLLQLREHWEAFRSDGSKRLLVWQVPDNAVRMVQCFFEAQKYETEYSTSDLFIVFDAPFEHSIQYSRALKEALAGQYEASRGDLEHQGITPDWQFDPEAPHSPTGFVHSLLSFGSTHHASIGHLVAVLMPTTVTDDSAYASWLTGCLSANMPERSRLLTIDLEQAPRLETLLKAAHPLVAVDAPRIDALATAQETFAQEAASGPAAVFRNFLIGLVTLVEKGSADDVKAKAMDAFDFARKQGWADQEVVIRMMLGGAFLKEKRFDEAVAIYAGARESASSAEATGHPAGGQLVLQTWFGEAGAHLAAGDIAQSARCYDEAAVVAGEIPNVILTIEAYRMGMFCHARIGQRETAIERGMEALAHADLLKPEARVMTTLPLTAVDLLRVVEPERVKSMEAVKSRLMARIDASRETVEQRARELGQGGEPQEFAAVEQALADETTLAEEVATAELEAVAASGGEEFSEVFSAVKTLLSARWPHSLLDALPHTSSEPAAEQPAGTASS